MESIEFSDDAHKVVVAVGTFFVMVYGIWVARLLRKNFQMPHEESGKSTLSALLAPSGKLLNSFSSNLEYSWTVCCPSNATDEARPREKLLGSFKRYSCVS